MKSKSAFGFTLMELAVVLVIVAIIATFAVPVTTGFIDSSGRRSATANLIALLNLARNTAIAEHTSVTICSINSDRECADDWHLPIVAFRDPERSKTIDDTAQIVRSMQSLETGRLIVRSGIHNHFSFTASGWSKGTLGNFVWCPESNDSRYAAQVRINMGGRPRTAKDFDGDGVVESASGDPIDCSGI